MTSVFASAVVRRTAIFVAVFGGGLTVVARTSGGLFVDEPESVAPVARATVSDDRVVPLDRGSSLGPGRGGRLDRDNITVVGGRTVPFRELTAEWATSEPVASRDPGVRLLKLGGARIVFYPRPTDVAKAGAAEDDGAGSTSVAGREALLRQREGAPASAHLDGDCSATHRVSAADEITLRSEALEVRTEERGAAKTPVHVIETDLPVRIEGGGSVITGTGLVAELDTGRGSGSQRTVRIRKDVAGTIRSRPDPKRPGAGTGSTVNLRCDGTADIEAVDRPGRDGRQPWRATFRDDVRFDEGLSTLTGDVVVVDFVRTGTADRAAGADTTEVRGVTATGQVRIDSRDAAAAYHVECERLRRYAEDALTEVTILEGEPLLRWEGRAQGAAADAPLSVYEVRCTGPATMRARRSAAAKDAPANVTITFEGDVQAVERRADTKSVRSEVRAPRVTIECKRAADGRLDPRLVRAEQGATAKFLDLDVRAQSIVAEAPQQPGWPQRIVLTGSPAASYALPEGASPLGGREPAGRLVLTSEGRIEADLAPEAADGKQPTGTRVATRVTGGMLARKMVGDAESWRLVSKEGDAKVGWDGALEEMHATGAARLKGRGGEGPDDKTADLSGSRITLTRPAAPAKGAPPDKNAWKRLDALVESAPGTPAVAVLTDGADAARRHEVRGNRLSYGEDGTVVVARGAAHADLHAKPDKSGRGGGALTADADELRIDLDPHAGGRASARLLTATGAVTLRDAMHVLTADRIVYQVLRGEADATGRPARVRRFEDQNFPSYAAGPQIRAWFDPAAAGDDRFVRATLPKGGEIVAYHAKPARERVTTTCSGPLELTRTTASCVQQVVSVFESRGPDGSWSADSRIDCRRLDMTFDPSLADGRPSEKIRSLDAEGTADDPVRVRTRNPTGDREAYAEAERVRCDPSGAMLRLDCPSGRTTVYLHDVSTGRRGRCESIEFNYVTFEWTKAVRWREVE